MADRGDDYRPDPDALVGIFGYRFNDADLLTRALTHSSVTGYGDRLKSNERLEFFGDRVLGLVIAEMLLTQFPEEDEGAIAKRFTALVRAESLTRIARKIRLGDHLIVSKGERDTGGTDKANVLADACEALIAALYQDGGLPAAAQFIQQHWQPLLEETPAPPKDYKTTLQEWVQARGLPRPSYQQTNRSGPAHAPIFTIEVAVTGYPTMTGNGTSKRAAEQKAAAALLEKLESVDE